MHALYRRVSCCQQQAAAPLPRCLRSQVHSVKQGRRDVLISTFSLLSAGAAEASEEEQAAAVAADGTATAAVGSGAAAAAKKPRKKRRKLAPKPKAELKQPGVVPKVKLAENLSVSRVIRGCWQLDGQHK